MQKNIWTKYTFASNLRYWSLHFLAINICILIKQSLLVCQYFIVNFDFKLKVKIIKVIYLLTLSFFLSLLQSEISWLFLEVDLDISMG